MSNSLVTIDMVTREALRIAHEKLTFIGTIDQSYDDSFARTGAKIGDTLRVRMPNQYTRRKGSRVMDVQDQDEKSETVTVAVQDGVDMRFNSAELSLSIDDLSRRYIEPAMSVLVAGVEGDVLQDCIKKTYQVVGSPGTVVGTSGDLSALYAARAKLNQQLAPKDSNRSVQLDSVTMGVVANGLKNLFHPSGQISESFTEGFIAKNAMASWYENEKTWTLTPDASDHAGAVDDTGSLAAYDESTGLSGLTIDSLASTPGIVAGAVFTIADLYDVHPETKQPYSHLKQFTVLSVTSGASSHVTVTFAPAIKIGGARQNCYLASGDITDLEDNVVTFWGTASSTATYRQNLMYHKDAFTFVTADLPLMDDAHRCVRRRQDNLSLRVWQASDIRNDELLMRIDILYGWKVLRPEWACRISN